MFRLSSRSLGMLPACVTSNRCFLSRTHPVFSLPKHSHQSLTVQSPKFYSSLPEKSDGFERFYEKVVFNVGSTTFIFNILKSPKEIVLSITENDKETHQYKRHIWLGIPAAKTLKKIKIKNLIKSCIGVPITEFIDQERQYLIRLALENDRLGNVHLKILQRNLIESNQPEGFEDHDSLKPTLLESSTRVDLSKEQLIKQRDQELAALKSDTMAKLAALGNSTVSKEELQKEIAELKEKCAKQIQEIRDKYKGL